MNKDKSLIPKGSYCYGNDREDKCPYWEFIEENIHHENPKENCAYYIRCKDNSICGTTPVTKCKSNVIRCNYLGYTDEVEAGWLWDQVKECRINE